MEFSLRMCYIILFTTSKYEMYVIESIIGTNIFSRFLLENLSLYTYASPIKIKFIELDINMIPK